MTDAPQQLPRLLEVQDLASAQAPPGQESPSSDQGPGTAPDGQTVEQPGKVMRIGTMIRQLLDEVRQAPLDEASRIRLRQIYDASLQELQEGLSADLVSELARMAPAFHPEAVPSESELRVAQAQLVGWLEGLFHGIQATIFAQQMAQRQVEEARRRGLPTGRPGQDDPPAMPGTYL